MSQSVVDQAQAKFDQLTAELDSSQNSLIGEDANLKVMEHQADAACERCGTEFMVGSRFCHVCGTARQGEAAVSARNWTRYLEFHNIQEGLGLSTASLIAFFLGAVCVLFTVATDWIYSERTVLEWQAVQAFRIQALLGAIAAFVAGILDNAPILPDLNDAVKTHELLFAADESARTGKPVKLPLKKNE